MTTTLKCDKIEGGNSMIELRKRINLRKKINLIKGGR
nr:MAG TPA: hypothetical protein [Caudoviricetes sp.]